MVNVQSQIEMLEQSLECFYPFKSCASDLDRPPSGRPPRAKKGKKKSKSSSGKNSSSSKHSQRESREERESSRHSTRDRSRSKSRERYLLKEAAEKRMENRTLKKRIGAAYIRSADSIATKETGLLSAHNRDELVEVNRSEDTFTTGSVSRSSSDELSSDSDINTSSDEVSDSITTRLRNINRMNDARSITTEDVESKPGNAFSWFQAKVGVNKTENTTEGQQSDNDSVGAVKRTIRSKFDYIRKNQRFTNPFPDPPSDRSMATSHSIRAEDAGSLLFRGRRQCKENKDVIRANEMVARRNELVKQIMQQKQRSIMVSRPGFDP